MNDVTLECFIKICEKLPTPFAYKALCYARRNEWKEVAGLRLNPRKYTCSTTLAMDLQVQAFLKKYAGLPCGSDKDRRAKAEASFWEAERQCFQTNRRLTPLLDDKFHYGSRLAEFLSVWRKKVKRLLGRCPSWDLLNARFGSGATFGNRGDAVSIADKLSEDYTSLKMPRDLIADWDQTAWSYSAACGLVPPFTREELSHEDPSPYAIRDIAYVRGNRFTTVPKDWSKDRGICVEPSITVFYQLGIGDWIARRLKRSGVDKYRGQDYHQTLARIASMTGACATIDLSSASDTVSEVLIKLLVPDDWWRLLTSVRSAYTLINGRWVRLEKFSSMGNGYTFELETVVFYTLAQTVAQLEGIREDPYTPGLTISCYGDDIIIPTSLSKCMLSALRFFGFTPNEDKTFIDGPFRESCGGDYHRGANVRAVYIKEVADAPERLIALANGLYRLGNSVAGSHHAGLHLEAWHRVLNQIPRQIRQCRGPIELGDIVIHDDRWVQYNPMVVRQSIRYLRVWRPVLNREIPLHHFRPGVVMAAALAGSLRTPDTITAYTLRRKPIQGFVPKIRGTYISGYRFGRVAYS